MYELFKLFITGLQRNLVFCVSLKQIIRYVIITPQILTETSNSLSSRKLQLAGWIPL